MNKSNQIIEKEYRFLIDIEKLKISPPVQIGSFILDDQKTKTHTDYLFEREELPLKNENIGFRIRQIGENLEFTYKKFLGKENGVVNYDEFTIPISQETLQSFKRGDFEHKDLPILKKLSTKGTLYFLLEIENKRSTYLFSHGSSKIEVMLEDIKYKNGSNTVTDSMMEIEINVSEEDSGDLDIFVETLKKMYGCVDMNEGKNTRAERLLGINQ